MATFTYTQGAHEVEPPAGWEDYFGTRPLYRFVDTRHGDNFEQLRRLRHMPYSINAEDAIRMCQERSQSEDWHQQVWREAMNDVFRTLDEHTDVDAVIGYSEGAMVGASLVVEEAEQARRIGRQRRIKVCEDAHSLRWAPGSMIAMVRAATDRLSVCRLHFGFASP